MPSSGSQSRQPETSVPSSMHGPKHHQQHRPCPPTGIHAERFVPVGSLSIGTANWQQHAMPGMKPVPSSLHSPEFHQPATTGSIPIRVNSAFDANDKMLVDDVEGQKKTRGSSAGMVSFRLQSRNSMPPDVLKEKSKLPEPVMVESTTRKRMNNSETIENNNPTFVSHSSATPTSQQKELTIALAAAGADVHEKSVSVGMTNKAVIPFLDKVSFEEEEELSNPTIDANQELCGIIETKSECDVSSIDTMSSGLHRNQKNQQKFSRREALVKKQIVAALPDNQIVVAPPPENQIVVLAPPENQIVIAVAENQIVVAAPENQLVVASAKKRKKNVSVGDVKTSILRRPVTRRATKNRKLLLLPEEDLSVNNKKNNELSPLLHRDKPFEPPLSPDDGTLGFESIMSGSFDSSSTPSL